MVGKEVIRQQRQDVVESGERLPAAGSDESIARIEAQTAALPALLQAGETETIKRLRAIGNAAALTARELGYRREASALHRQAVVCSACLGELLGLRRYDADELPPETKLTQMRALGAAMNRGGLEAVLNACGEFPLEGGAARIASRMGYTRVRRKKVLALLQTHYPGRNLLEVLREHGVSDSRAKYLLEAGATSRHSDRALWWYAYELLSVCGVSREQILKLPLQPHKSDRIHRLRARWITHRFRPGRGQHDEVEVRRVKLMVQLNHVNPDWDAVPGLYEALKTISDYTRREILREEKSRSAAP